MCAVCNYRTAHVQCPLWAWSHGPRCQPQATTQATTQARGSAQATHPVFLAFFAPKPFFFTNNFLAGFGLSDLENRLDDKSACPEVDLIGVIVPAHIQHTQRRGFSAGNKEQLGGGAIS